MRFLPFTALTLIVITTSVSAQAPAGWKTITDVRKTCQISVPAAWTEKTSTAYAPGEKATATVHALRATQTFEQGKDMTKSVMKPIKIVQDDAKRLMYTMDPGPTAGANKNGWYVIANTTPVCTVSFTFAPGADEATLTKIADTLKLAAK